MPAAKLFTLNRDSSTSGDPSRAACASRWPPAPRKPGGRRPSTRTPTAASPAHAQRVKRVERHQQAERHEGIADEVELEGLGGLGLADEASSRISAAMPTGRLMRKIGRHSQTEQVPLGEQRAEQRAGHGAQADDRAKSPKTLPRSCAGKVA